MTMHAFRSALIVLATAAAAWPQTGAEFRVNSYTTGRQFDSHVAVEPDGDFVVVWTSNGQTGANAVIGQRYDATGVRRGGEFQVNTSTIGYRAEPSVAVGSGGDFVVVWSGMADGSGGSVQAQRFDAAGSPLGSEFMVNTYTFAYQKEPKVGLAADGRFVIVWQDRTRGVQARRFDASGSPAGGEIQLTTNLSEFAYGDVAVAANGDFVVAYEAPDGSDKGVFAQRFDAAGNRQGAEIQVNDYTVANQALPSVSLSPTGGFVAVWGSTFGDLSGNAVFARRFDASGNPVGSNFVVNTYTTGGQFVDRSPAVAHDGAGNFVVTWRGPGDGSAKGVFAQRFDPSGAPRGGEFRVNSYTTGDQSFAAIASDAAGNFVVTWDSAIQDRSQSGIFGRRLVGLEPIALSIDAAGNGMLEPGETVEMKPSWLNISASDQTVTGTLDTFVGPPGAVHSILDATAAYGTLAIGGSASCTDCYTVSVSDPASRPVVHWDATVVENLFPAALGEKTWVMHVGRSFTDVDPASPFYPFIETLLHHGVTGGCSATEYCPAAPTTRAQMAVFVLVAKEGRGYAPPACTTPMFFDVPVTSPFCPWIQELAARGVVTGCTADTYCPDAPVTREQMAVFVVRTMDPAYQPFYCTVPPYADVPLNSPFCRYIRELTLRGVVTGCGGGNYCPAEPVTREQMGVFLGRTFGLSLYPP